MTPRTRLERGSVTLFVAAVFPAVLAFVALVADGGRLITARHAAIATAATAARAAAQEIDEGAFAVEHRVQLRPGPARRSAETAATAAGTVDGVTVDVAGDRVTVTVTRRIELPFLALLGVPRRTVEGTATARAAAGVTNAP